MIDMSSHGYRSAAAFLRDKNIPRSTFDSIIKDKYWCVVKRALLHKECPMDIREQFRNDPTWYKRFVAIYASAAPVGYVKHALKDPSPRVRNAYLRPLYRNTTEFLGKLGVKV